MHSHYSSILFASFYLFFISFSFFSISKHSPNESISGGWYVCVLVLSVNKFWMLLTINSGAFEDMPYFNACHKSNFPRSTLCIGENNDDDDDDGNNSGGDVDSRYCGCSFSLAVHNMHTKHTYPTIEKRALSHQRCIFGRAYSFALILHSINGIFRWHTRS